MKAHNQLYFKQHFKKILILILIAGALLRIVSFDWGLPKDKFHVSIEEDEKYFLLAVRNMDISRLDLDPNFYIHGPFVPYLWEGTLSIARIFGLADHNLDEEYLAKNPAKYRKAILVGRVQALIVGLAFILMTALVFARRFGHDTALLAAAFLAFAWEPVHHSGVVRHDQPAALFIMLMVAQGYNIIKPGRRVDYIMMGVLVALTTATVYPAGIWLGGILFITAHLYRCKTEKTFSLKGVFNKNVAQFALSSIVIFFVLVPFPVIRFKEFLDFTSVLNSGWEADVWHVSRLTQGLKGAEYLLFRITPYALGFVFCIFAYIALVYGWVKRPRQWLLLLIVPTIHIISLAIITQKFTRHVVFLTGPLVVLTARFMLYDMKDFLEKSTGKLARPLVIVLVSLVLVFTLAQTISVLVLQSRVDFPTEISNWFEQNIPEGTTIATTGSPVNMIIPPLDPRHFKDLKPKYNVVEDVGRNMNKLINSKAQYLVDPHFIIYGMHNKFLVEEKYSKERKYIHKLESGKNFVLIKTFENDLGWLKFLFKMETLPVDMYRVNLKVYVYKSVE